MIHPNPTASSLFRPRCSTCLQEVQRGFFTLSRVPFASRLNHRAVIFPFRRAWVYLYLCRCLCRCCRHSRSQKGREGWRSTISRNNASSLVPPSREMEEADRMLRPALDFLLSDKSEGKEITCLCPSSCRWRH